MDLNNHPSYYTFHKTLKRMKLSIKEDSTSDSVYKDFLEEKENVFIDDILCCILPLVNCEVDPVVQVKFICAYFDHNNININWPDEDRRTILERFIHQVLIDIVFFANHEVEKRIKLVFCVLLALGANPTVTTHMTLIENYFYEWKANSESCNLLAESGYRCSKLVFTRMSRDQQDVRRQINSVKSLQAIAGNVIRYNMSNSCYGTSKINFPTILKLYVQRNLSFKFAKEFVDNHCCT